MAQMPRLAAVNNEYRFFDLEYFFQAAERNGFEAVELWTGPMHFFLDYQGHDPVAPVQELARRHGVEFAAVCPEQNNPKPGNIASRDALAQARVLAYFKNAIDVAVELGAPIVTVTSGWGYLNEPVEAALARSVAMLRDIASYAGQRGVTLAMEALQPDETNLPSHTAAQVARIIEAVGSPALKVCLDTGAMDAAGDTIQGYFDTFGSDVVHCHFVDTAEVSHVVWGQGHRNMAADLASLQACGYGGWLTVESVDERYLTDPAKADACAMALYRQAMREIQA